MKKGCFEALQSGDILGTLVIHGLNELKFSDYLSLLLKMNFHRNENVRVWNKYLFGDSPSPWIVIENMIIHGKNKMKFNEFNDHLVYAQFSYTTDSRIESDGRLLHIFLWKYFPTQRTAHSRTYFLPRNECFH